MSVTITQSVQQINVTITQNGVSLMVQPVITNNGKGSEKQVFVSVQDQTQFLLSDIPSNVDVYVDRVYQLLTVDYAVLGNMITLVNPLDAGSIVEIRKYY